jgi:hypothetical protein
MVECRPSGAPTVLNITQRTLQLFKSIYTNRRVPSHSLDTLRNLILAELLLDSPIVSKQLAKAVAHHVKNTTLYALMYPETIDE